MNVQGGTWNMTKRNIEKWLDARKIQKRKYTAPE